MKKIIFLILLIADSFICFSQINEYDENQKKNGKWNEDGVIGEYSHGKKVGKWSYNFGSIEYDAQGAKIREVTYFNNNPALISHIEEYKNGALTYQEIYFKKSDGTTELNSITSKTADGYFDGTNWKIENAMKKEAVFNKGIPIKNIVYYPNSDQPFIILEFSQQEKKGTVYYAVYNNETIYHKNGKIWLQFNPSLPYTFNPSYFILAEAPSYHILPQKRDNSNLLDTVVKNTIYNENGTVNMNIKYTLTGDITNANYGLDGTYKGRKYYKGAPDSVWVETNKMQGYTVLKEISLYNKGIKIKSETYSGLGTAGMNENCNVLVSNYDSQGKLDGSQRRYYVHQKLVEEKQFNHGNIKAEPPKVQGDFVSEFPNIYKDYELKSTRQYDGFIYDALKNDTQKQAIEENKSGSEKEKTEEKKKKKIKFGDILNELK